MPGLLSVTQALIEAQKPTTFALHVKAEEADDLHLPEPWVHATALDRAGMVTFVEPERLVRVKLRFDDSPFSHPSDSRH